jgi:fructokinase
MFVPKSKILESEASFSGVCLYHGDCFEGLASGPAIKARWNIAAEELPIEHPAWQIEAQYLAYAFVNIVLTVAPECLIIGGGIGLRKGLLEMVAAQMEGLLGVYIEPLNSKEAIQHFLLPAALGNNAGILGAAELGRLAALRHLPIPSMAP